MSVSDDERQPLGTAGKLIVEAYASCVRAKLAYIRASKGSGNQPQAHEAFHNAVLEFYHVLRYKLSQSNTVSRYWKEVPVFEWQPVYATNEEGNVLADKNDNPIIDEYQPMSAGLQQLDGYTGAYEREERDVSNAFGAGTVDSPQPVLLTPEMCFECAQALEGAADQLGFLAHVDTPVADPEEAVV